MKSADKETSRNAGIRVRDTDGDKHEAIAKSPTDLALEDLDQELRYVWEAFDRLNRRLNPVQTPACDKCAEDKTKELSRGASPIVQSIQSVRSSVSALRDAINGATDRLEV